MKPMYHDFYHFNQDPFNLTADPDFLYLSQKHREVLEHLIYGIQQRKGFLLVTGEVGTGKTTLCKELLNRLRPMTKTAFIFNANLPEQQLLQAIVGDFGIELKNRSKLGLLNGIYRFLLEQADSHGNTVLVLDEAQDLSDSTLEQIRLLSNLETQKMKLLQIVLAGQPELEKKLLQPHLRQLRQRIAIRSFLTPLSREETDLYIQHRIRVAGGEGHVYFTSGASGRVYHYAKGIPRMMNLVCDRSLLAGFVENRREITDELVNHAIEELEGVTV